MSQIDFSPSAMDMASYETLPLSFDMTAYISSGDTITNPAAHLVQLLDNTDYSIIGLSGSPVVSGYVITQIVTRLLVGRYRLTITFTANTNKIWAGDLILNCPF